MKTTSKLVRVHMDDSTITVEDLGGFSKHGGRGLTSMIVSKEVPPRCNPLGTENKLVIAPGLLGGTNAPNSGRLSIGAKSPLTWGIKESNVGGTAAFKLARLGIRALVVEGKAEEGRLHYLLVTKDGVGLCPADEYKGEKNYRLAEMLRKKHGEKVGILSIGPAGEMRMTAASIAATDPDGHPSRHAGRGGLGAVMGAKGLKAIVIDDSGAEAIEYADREGFKQAAATFRDVLKSHDITKPGGGLATYGTNVLMNIINQAGALPTKNFTCGQFEGAEKISGETMHAIIKERGGRTTHAGCSTCIIQCSNVYLDKDRNYLTSALEYETVWANGANCGIDDLDAIAQIDRLCDDYGLDTMEVGCAIGVAMAAGIRRFGDAAGAIALVDEIGKGTPLGRIMGDGAAATAKFLGVKDAPVVKGQSLAAYDPRAVKGQGVTYATSPMGADHTAGYCITMNVLGCGGFVDPLKVDGQVELSRNLQVVTAALDSVGLCIFVAFAILDFEEGVAAIRKMLNARFGWKMAFYDLSKEGEEVLRAERAFNRAAGFTKQDDRLPKFFREKALAPHNTVFDVPDRDLDGVFAFIENEEPSRDKAVPGAAEELDKASNYCDAA